MVFGGSHGDDSFRLVKTGMDRFVCWDLQDLNSCSSPTGTRLVAGATLHISFCSLLSFFFSLRRNGRRGINNKMPFHSISHSAILSLLELSHVAINLSFRKLIDDCLFRNKQIEFENFSLSIHFIDFFFKWAGLTALTMTASPVNLQFF